MHNILFHLEILDKTSMEEMQQERYLYVHNFGPISEMRIELKPFMVFIGDQGTGKSTITKLLSIFNEIKWLGLNDKKEQLKVFADYGIINYFKEDTILEFRNEYVIVKISGKGEKLSISDIGDLGIKNLQNGMSKFEKNRKGYSNIKEILDIIESNDKLKKEMYDEAGEAMTTLKEEVTKYFQLAREIDNINFAIYFPAERNFASVIDDSIHNLLVNDISIPYLLKKFLALFETAKKETESYAVSYLDLTYEKTGNPECIRIDDNKYLRLRECSSGVQSTLPLLMVMDNELKKEDYRVVVVEEPEQNLFPENQRFLLNFIVSCFNKKEHKTNMAISTHSPYMLSILNNCILADMIVKKNPEAKENVEEIMPSVYHLSADDVAVYALDNTGEEYCKSVVDPDTKLISGNFLDSVSETISSDFNRLYKLYIKALRK